MKNIPLTQGKVAIVDDKDFEKISAFKWHAILAHNGRWYAKRGVRLPNDKWTTQYMARFVMGLQPGDLPEVDHRNHKMTLDNRRKNLRVTLTQNQQNVGKRKDNTSGLRGISWHNATGKWRAQITINGQQIHLGLFTTLKAARNARHVAALKYHGEFRGRSK